MTVLIATSSSQIRERLQDACAVLGHRTIIAGSGDELATVLSANFTEIILIVTEWNLPDQSGEETLRFIRDDKRFRALPVMVLTEANDNPAPVQIISAGATDCLTIAATHEDLITRIYDCSHRAA